MVTNAYGVEVTDEHRAEGAAIVTALTDLQSRYDALLELLGVGIGDGFGSNALDDAIGDVAMDIGRFTDTDDSEEQA